jgi:hypothetical protein
MRDLVDRVYMCIGMVPYWFPSESHVSIDTVCSAESVKWSKCVESYVRGVSRSLFGVNLCIVPI